MRLLVLGDFFYSYDFIADDIFIMGEYIKNHGLGVILNLEGAITRSNSEIKKRGEHLRQSPKTLEVLRILNVKGVSLSNNHIFDFGKEGLAETIDALDEAGILHCGAGLDIYEALKPMCLQWGDYSYEFYGMTDFYEESIQASDINAGCGPIHNLQSTVSIKDGVMRVALIHSGFEYNSLPMPRNIKQYRTLLQKGFDAVVASHPHVLQPWEIYKGKPITYSLGNFYFSEYRQEFHGKTIRGEEPGYCDIGMGIILGQPLEIIDIQYNHDTGESRFTNRRNMDSTLMYSADFKYRLSCYKNRNNHNPILTGNEISDTLRLKTLDSAYFVYGQIKKLIHR